MKILFTNHRMRDRGGSELFTLEVATEAILRGHQAAVFSTVGGPLADALQAAGIPFLTHPAECPFTPDVIHGQHHLEAIAALCAWPGVPALYFVHGYGPWEERPPVHPRLLRYAVPCPAFLPWLEKICQAGPDAVRVIPNFFDPTRFPRQREGPPNHPRRALVYHNTIDSTGPLADAIRRACPPPGWTLVFRGASSGQVLENPGDILPTYDVIFASGRSALEAMACGAAVIPITRDASGPWISQENFTAALAQNFSVRPDDPNTAAELAAILQQIDFSTLPAIAHRVRQTLTLTTAVDQLEALWIELPTLPQLHPPAAESAAMATYLTTLTAQVKQVDHDRALLLEKRDEAQRRATRWKEKADQASQKLTKIRTTLENGPWWHRRLQRRLERGSNPDHS